MTDTPSERINRYMQDVLDANQWLQVGIKQAATRDSPKADEEVRVRRAALGRQIKDTTDSIVYAIAESFVTGGDTKAIAKTLEEIVKDDKFTVQDYAFKNGTIPTLWGIAEHAAQQGTFGRDIYLEVLQKQLNDMQRNFDSAFSAQHPGRIFSAIASFDQRAVYVLDHNNAALTEQFKEVGKYCVTKMAEMTAYPEMAINTAAIQVILAFVDRVLLLQDANDLLSRDGDYHPHDRRPDPLRPTLREVGTTASIKAPAPTPAPRG